MTPFNCESYVCIISAISCTIHPCIVLPYTPSTSISIKWLNTLKCMFTPMVYSFSSAYLTMCMLSTLDCQFQGKSEYCDHVCAGLMLCPGCLSTLVVRFKYLSVTVRGMGFLKYISASTITGNYTLTPFNQNVCGTRVLYALRLGNCSSLCIMFPNNRSGAFYPLFKKAMT